MVENYEHVAREVQNIKFFAGAAAAAVETLVRYLGRRVNVWMHPKGYLVIPLHGLKGHEEKFIAKIPRYLQTVYGRPVGASVRGSQIQIPAENLPEFISALKKLESLLRGNARRNVKVFRRYLEKLQ